MDLAVIPLLVVAVAAYFYVRHTVPILGIRASQADNDPRLFARVSRGMVVNWTIAVVLMFAAFATREPIFFVSLAVPVLSGAWMEIIKGHPGAD